MSNQNFIPLSIPSLGGNAVQYVNECIETEWVSYLGSYVNRFEDDLAEKSGAPYVTAMNSGTSALHIALIMAGVGMDDEVIMPAITFVSPANAVRYCGAWPAFIDISEDDWQMDLTKTEDFLANRCERRQGQCYNKLTGRRVAALMPVHLLGCMADVDGFAELARKYKLPLVEDGAESLGATYKGRKMADPLPNFSDVRRFVCTSFNGNKIITTGGGGALFSYCIEDADRAKHLSTTAKTDPLEFIHDEVGYNYRLTNPAAALGCSQLEKLEEHVLRKREIAARYGNMLGGDNRVRLMPDSKYGDSSYWLYTILLKQRDSLPVIKKLGDFGIQTRPLWKPLPQLGYLSKYSHIENYEVGDKVQRSAISLPCSVGISISDQNRVVEALFSIL